MPETQQELVHRAVTGDEEALSQLLRIHGPAVERSLQIGAVYQSMIEPSDVMQVTYLEAFMRISSFDPQRAGSFEAWLRQIAHNNLRDAIRGLERQKNPPPRDRVLPRGYEDSLVGLYDLLGGSSSATPSRSLRRQEACSLLEQAIRTLPDRYAQVIRMYDLEGRPISEVARAIGKSAGAVHMLRARAHDWLREGMGPESQFFSTSA